MTLVLQVSDTHFGTERPEVVEDLVKLAEIRQPDVLVYSGDITQRARRAQFQAAARFCERLAVPRWLVLPGNHDVPLYDVVTRAFAPYRLFRKYFGADFEPVLDLPGILLLGVKTTRRYRHKNGEVSAEQVARVAERLRAAGPDQLRVVVTHQPVDVPRAEDEHDMLRGAAGAVASWIDAGADVVLGGHIHLPFIRPLSQRYPDLARRAWCVQAGTAVSHRVRGKVPNSVNFIEHAGGSGLAYAERWDHLGKQGFARVERVEMALDRRPA